MKKTIFKAQLEITNQQLIEIPLGSKILSLQTQNGIPCIWFLCNPEEPKIQMKVLTFGTGHPIPLYLSEDEFIGTYQIDNGSLVFHVFREFG